MIELATTLEAMALATLVGPTMVGEVVVWGRQVATILSICWGNDFDCNYYRACLAPAQWK